ncbi:hypothetical protein BDV19DRAFT_217383 [Aspergillus venezuelensis]
MRQANTEPNRSEPNRSNAWIALGKERDGESFPQVSWIEERERESISLRIKSWCKVSRGTSNDDDCRTRTEMQLAENSSQIVRRSQNAKRRRQDCLECRLALGRRRREKENKGVIRGKASGLGATTVGKVRVSSIKTRVSNAKSRNSHAYGSSGQRNSNE